MKICQICKKYQIPDEKAMCYSCSKTQHDTQVRKKIKNGEDDEVFREDTIYCPWCGRKLGSDFEHERITIGYHERECPYCYRQFSILTEVDSKYTTQRNSNH